MSDVIVREFNLGTPTHSHRCACGATFGPYFDKSELSESVVDHVSRMWEIYRQKH